MSEIAYVDGWPQPYPQMDAEPYWAALNEGRLTHQHCTGCERAVWPAHSECPHCGARALEWRPSAGRGRVYSFSTLHRGPTPHWQARVPYTVGFVAMDEGHFLFTEIVAPPDAVAIDMPVTLRLETRGAQVLPVFVPEGAGP